MKSLLSCGTALLLLSFSVQAQSVITTVAGAPNTSLPPNVDAKSIGIQPTDVSIGPDGAIYFADAYRSEVLKLSGGKLSVVAGNGLSAFSGDGGAATNASLNRPLAILVDPQGAIYIADSGNARIRKVMPDGIISTIAGNGTSKYAGDGTLATRTGFIEPSGLALDSANNLYVSDDAANRVYRVTSDGKIRTVAGTTEGYGGDLGPATQAKLSSPFGLAVDASDNLYIADFKNNRIRKVTTDGVISTVVGDGVGRFTGDFGPANQASLHGPSTIVLDAQGNMAITDSLNARIRIVTVDDNQIATVVGNGKYVFGGEGSKGPLASVIYPSGITLSATGIVFADFNANRVLQVDYSDISLHTLAGDGSLGYSGDGFPAVSAGLGSPMGLAIDSTGTLYIADYYNSRVRKVTRDGIIQTAVGNGVYDFAGDGGRADQASLRAPYGLFLDSAGNLYISDFDDSRIRKVTPSGIISTVAGNGACQSPNGDEGPAAKASLCNPTGVAVDSAGNIYIADFNGHRVRKVTTDGIIHTFAGTGASKATGNEGPATRATMSSPFGLAIDASGNVYISDQRDNVVRKVTSDGIIHAFAGDGQFLYSSDGIPAIQASVAGPEGLVIDHSGAIYIAEQGSERVRVVGPDGVIGTIAGSGYFGYSGDGGLAANATFRRPRGLALDASGALYISDFQNFRVRKVFQGGVFLQTSTTSLNLNAAARGGVSSAATLVVSSSIPGVPFTVTSSQAWLSVNSDASTVAPARLQVQADPSSLSAGTYTAVLTVSSPLAPSVQVAVALSVGVAGSPQLFVNSSPLRFAIQSGTKATPLSFAVTNLGGGALDLSLSANQPWVAITAPANRLSAGQSTSFTVAVDGSELSLGTHTALITVKSAATGQIGTVPVVVTVTAAAAHITLSQTALTFTAIAGGGRPLSQSFGIVNTGSGVMNWTASASTPAGGSVSWLNLSNTNGSVARANADVSLVEVNADPGSLSAGDYYAQIRVRSDNGDNSPQSVTVAFHVAPAGSKLPPDIQPSGLIFTGTQSSTPGSQVVRIATTAAQGGSFVSSTPTAQSGNNWLQYQPSSAVLKPNAPTQVVVQPDLSRLSPGTYTSTINFGFDDGSVGTVKVLVVVAPSDAATSKGQSKDACGGVKIQYSGSQQSLAAPLGQPMSMNASTVDLCGRPVTPADSYAVFGSISNGDRLNFVHIGGGNWQTSWTPPQSIADSQSRIIITALPLLNSGGGDQLTLYVSHPSRSTAPFVPSNGIAYNATLAPKAIVAPGSLISIYGSSLADQAQGASSVPLGTSLGSTEVRLGDRPLPLQYVGPNQINAQIPYDSPLNQEMQLIVRRSDQLSSPSSITVAPLQPALFSDTQGRAIVTVAGASNVASSVKASDVLVFYGTGLGDVNPAPGAGDGAAGPAGVRNPVTVTFGGVQANVLYAGLTPGFPGLYQINLIVPNGLTSGQTVPVIITQNGVSSDPVTVGIQ